MNPRRSFLKANLAILAVSAGLISVHAADQENELPNVLIIGDSISIGYAPIVHGLLAGQANVTRPLNENGGYLNCEGTTRGVQMIDEWLAAAKWDLIHFNFGLHDLKHVHPKTGQNSNAPEHPQQADLAQYEANLEEIVKKLKATGAKLIFATTTPYPDEPGGPLRRADQAAKYNQVALKVMKNNDIRVNDLHAFVLPRMEQVLLPKNVHFNVNGSRALAHRVAEEIRKALPTSNAAFSRKRQAWEHLALPTKDASDTGDRSLARQINRLGDEGWQLVNVSPIVENGTTQKTIFYFKRPK